MAGWIIARDRPWQQLISFGPPGFSAYARLHPGLLVDGLRKLAARLESTGCPVTWDADFPGYDRFHSADPFGNRLEFLESESG